MQPFFNPSSVAILGAPRKTGEGSNNIVEILLRFGYQGRIYPINPRAKEIAGLKAFSAVEDLPANVDLAIISLGRNRVLDNFKRCLNHNIKNYIIISQGFSDADENGKQLQNELVRLAEISGARIVGPNTLGVINAFSGFTSAFIEVSRPADPPPLAMIAQTGIIQVGQENFLDNNLGKTIDLGNMSDLDYVDVLEYLEHDPEIKVIAMHMEGLKRGKAFLETASRVAQKKPIIVLKSGRSAKGASAALSHTGSLVGEDEIFDIAFRRAGIIRANDTTEFKDFIKSLLKFPPMSSNNIGIITPSGGAGILGVDACEKEGLKTPPLSDSIMRKLKEVAPEWFELGNPVDLWPVGLNKEYLKVFELTFKDFWQREDIGGVIVGHVAISSPLHKDFNSYPRLYNLLKEHLNSTEHKKPLSIWIYGDHTWQERERLDMLPFTATFSSIERAVRGIGAAHRYFKLTNQSRKTPKDEVKINQSSYPGKMNNEKQRKKNILGLEALLRVNDFGVPIANTKYAQHAAGALDAAASLGYPVVLKAVTSEWLHKTEHGGVITGVKSAQEVKEKCDQLIHLAGEGLEGFLVQEQVAGKELILGIKRDPQFGHVIVCGTGGIYAEVLRDITRELLPINRELAERMLRSLKGYPMLAGVRGEKPVDLEKVVDTMIHLAHFALHNPHVKELDINPLIANPYECKAVDVRIIYE